MISSQSKSYQHRRKIIVPDSRKPWPHEIYVAEVLSDAGYRVEFLKEGNYPEADIKIGNRKYEIKSPETFNANTLEHKIKDAVKQSPNIIINTLYTQKIFNIFDLYFFTGVLNYAFFIIFLSISEGVIFL